MIFFSATDVGGARAIIPVLHELENYSVPFCMMDDGVLSSESGPSYRRVPLQFLETEEAFKHFLQVERVRGVCVGTAVEKRLPIYHSLWASQLGIPTVAILDNWMNYRQRFVLTNEGVVFPDRYFIMDQLAYDEALLEGVPHEILEITGHPGLAGLALEADKHEQEFLDGMPQRLVFVSEPAALDQGDHVGIESYRGYTEFDVLRHLSDFMVRYGGGYELLIAPHPREDKEALKSFCAGIFPPSVKWRLSPCVRGRDTILNSDGVIGMTSVLLYEAWLLGLPTISLQPGARRGGASHFLKREGCCFVSKAEDVQAALVDWLGRIVLRRKDGGGVRNDLLLHRSAPACVARRLKEVFADSIAVVRQGDGERL